MISLENCTIFRVNAYTILDDTHQLLTFQWLQIDLYRHIPLYKILLEHFGWLTFQFKIFYNFLRQFLQIILH